MAGILSRLEKWAKSSNKDAKIEQKTEKIDQDTLKVDLWRSKLDGFTLMDKILGIKTENLEE